MVKKNPIIYPLFDCIHPSAKAYMRNTITRLTVYMTCTLVPCDMVICPLWNDNEAMEQHIIIQMQTSMKYCKTPIIRMLEIFTLFNASSKKTRK